MLRIIHSFSCALLVASFLTAASAQTDQQAQAGNAAVHRAEGSKVRYSGSAIVDYMLFAPDSTLRTAETLYHHTGFLKMNSIRNGRGSANGQ